MKKITSKIERYAEEKYDEGWSDGYDAGREVAEHEADEMPSYGDGIEFERKRVEDVIKMNLTWAMDKNKGTEIVFWKNALEILVGIPRHMANALDEKTLREELEDYGF
jgi:hypothetical protein